MLPISSALARGLAELTRGSRVTVNSVLAGPTWSEGVGTFVSDVAAQRGLTPDAMQKDFFATVRPGSLIQRFATVEESVNVVAFIASPLAAVMSGAAVRAEGGLLQGTY